ncbi:MAG: class I SAM-dependent methyltransferase [Acidobacteriota bacterium]
MLKDVMKRQLARRDAWTLRRRLSGVELPEALAAVAGALSTALETIFEPVPDWARPIEAIRKRCRGSSATLDIVDFGAGPPDATRTWDEMAAGTRSSITLDQACRASKPYFWSLFLHSLAGLTAARTVVELGTCLGLSASYVATAGAQRVVTLEGAEPLAALAAEHFLELGLDTIEVVEGPFQATFARVLERSPPIDLLFVDGHHDEEATVRYFEQARFVLAPDALVVFDDIDWSDGMRRAWRAVTEAEGVEASVALGDLGVVALGNGARETTRLQVPARMVRYSQP